MLDGHNERNRHYRALHFFVNSFSLLSLWYFFLSMTKSNKMTNDVLFFIEKKYIYNIYIYVYVYQYQSKKIHININFVIVIVYYRYNK